VDVQCDKLASVVIDKTVCLRLSEHPPPSVSYDAREAARRAGPSATADTCLRTITQRNRNQPLFNTTNLTVWYILSMHTACFTGAG